MTTLHWIQPDDPPDAFPDPAAALHDPDGLLAAGGDLAPARLLAAYRRGIFPWYTEGQPVLWWCPDPRAVLFPQELYVSHRLARTLRRAGFTVTFDRAFDAVIAACSAPRRTREPGGTWITGDMQEAYRRLHRQGHAHSVEVWQNGVLAGGLYGVSVGRIFFGESMFSARRDASKIALVRLVRQLAAWDFPLLDCQINSAHLSNLGSRLIPRAEFKALLDRYCELDGPAIWVFDHD